MAEQVSTLLELLSNPIWIAQVLWCLPAALVLIDFESMLALVRRKDFARLGLGCDCSLPHPAEVLSS